MTTIASDNVSCCTCNSTFNPSGMDDEGTDDTGTINVADVIANEGRTDKVFGTGNPTVQTNITQAELTQAIFEGNRQADASSGLFDLPRTIAEGIQGIANAVLTSGVSVGGDGVSFGANAGAFTDAQVEALAASLGEDLDSSFRSDFIPTLLGNQPGTVQPGDPDPDEDTARAPAAARFDQAAASISAVADVLSLDALANVAQESTLSNIANSLGSIQIATEKTADAPLVDALLEAGVAFPFDARSPVPDTAALQTTIEAGLTQAGFDLFRAFEAIQSSVAASPNATEAIGMDAIGGMDAMASQSDILLQMIHATGQEAVTRLDMIHATGQEAAQGLLTMDELLTQASERPAGTSEDPQFVKLVSGETLKVEVTNQVRSVEATIVNSNPISVREQGTVQVVVNNTPLTVRIADLGTLLSQLSQQNTERAAFGGQTI